MLNIRYLSAWVPLLVGLYLEMLAAGCSLPGLVMLALAGALLVAGGIRSLVFTDLRAPQMVAAGAVLAALFALPLGLLEGADTAFAVLVAAVLAFLSGGWFQLRTQPQLEGVPAPAPTPAYAALVALDDAMLGTMAALTPMATPQALRDAVAESEAAHAILDAGGWLEAPWQFHRAPPPLSDVQLREVTVHGQRCQELSFASEFEPREGLPGRERWLGYRENRTAHALLLQQPGPAPWLVCVHGFGMGNPKNDFRAFRAAQMRARFGVNVALFVLPVHGARAPRGFNGAKFFGVSVLDLVHAQSHAIWDLRRLLGWIRERDASGIGVYGISLGGYTAAVLGGVEEGLDCVIAGIPPTDMIAHRDYLAGGQERRLAALAGVDSARDRAVHSVVAPLVLPPRVPQEGRFMFAATGDQFVPIEQVQALWQHWSQPRICWTTGGHLGALLQKAPRDLVDEALSLTIAARG